MVKCNNQLFFSPSVVAAITVAVLVYSGFVPIVNRNVFNSIIQDESIIQLEGRVVSNPTKTASGNYYSVSVDVAWVKSNLASSIAQGHIQLLVPSTIVEALYPGKLYSKLHSKAGLSTPIVEKGLLFNSSVTYLKTEKESSNQMPLYIANTMSSNGWDSALSKIRALSRLDFKRLLYAWGDAGGLLLALLSGSREYTSATLADGFRSAGLSHILALSGMHLSLFAGIALSSGKLVAGKNIATICSLCAVILFVWFAGASPSILRALICTLLSLLLEFCSLPGVSGNSEVLYRFISPSYTCVRLLRILSASFLIHIAFFPMDTYTPAFMLSYGALVGISIAEYAVKPWLVRLFPEKLASPLSASIGAQICTAPVTITLFGTIMPIGIVSSVIVSPLALGFLVLGFFSIVISMAIPFLLLPIGDIINLVYRVLEFTVLWFAQFPSIQF